MNGPQEVLGVPSHRIVEQRIWSYSVQLSCLQMSFELFRHSRLGLRIKYAPFNGSKSGDLCLVFRQSDTHLILMMMMKTTIMTIFPAILTMLTHHSMVASLRTTLTTTDVVLVSPPTPM